MSLFKPIFIIFSIFLCYNLFPAAVISSEESLEQQLLRATDESNYEKIKDLLDKGANINYVDSNGDCALHKALRTPVSKIINFLLLKGANPNLKNKLGETPFYMVLVYEDQDLIQTFIDYGARVGKKTNDAKKIEKVETLACSADKRSLIFLPKNVDIISVLLQSGGNKKITEGSESSFELTDLLPVCLSKIRLKREKIDKTLDTPLGIAIRNCNGNAVSILLQNNISISDINSPDIKETLLMLLGIENNNAFSCAIYGRALDKESYTYENIIQKDLHGMTPILWAACRGNIEILRIFLENGQVKSNFVEVLLTDTNEKNETAITLAGKNGHDEIVDFITKIYKTFINIIETKVTYIPGIVSLILEYNHKKK